jgi:CubicO group peptidase (beta-lactamase class C family)
LLGVYGQAILVDPELKLVMVLTAAARNAEVGKESLGAERDAIWRGVIRKYGNW